MHSFKKLPIRPIQFHLQIGDNGLSYNSPFTYEKKSKDYSYFVDMEDARSTHEPEQIFQ